MGFLAFLILGLIAGAIARVVLPGKQPGGFFVTLILGVLGAMLGGWLGGLLFNVSFDEFWSWSTWLFAIIGAIIVILIAQAIFGRSHVSGGRVSGGRRGHMAGPRAGHSSVWSRKTVSFSSRYSTAHSSTSTRATIVPGPHRPDRQRAANTAVPGGYGSSLPRKSCTSSPRGRGPPGRSSTHRCVASSTAHAWARAPT
jgi:uncharacterized membrane protein YeaQ/YmgE (transglycosylase-associated protein family)